MSTPRWMAYVIRRSMIEFVRLIPERLVCRYQQSPTAMSTSQRKERLLQTPDKARISTLAREKMSLSVNRWTVIARRAVMSTVSGGICGIYPFRCLCQTG